MATTYKEVTNLILPSINCCFVKKLYSTTICIKTEIPQEICDIDDELKAIYHSKDTICIWVFKNREDRNKFMDETAGMIKNEREKYYDNYYK